MAKLAFISTMSGAPWGGSEELWSQTALRLHGQSHAVSASIVAWPKLSPQILKLRNSGVGVWARSGRPTSLRDRVWHKLRNVVGAAPKEVSWLRRQSPDLVIVSQGYCQDGVPWMRLCMELRLPFVTIVHCNSDALWPSDESSGDMASAYRAAKVVFCVSRHNLELLECQIGEALTNSQIVWNPFNVPGGEPTAWPANDGIWKLACVGRLDPGAKGQDLLFHTLSQPQWSGRPVEINLYGSGPCENSLRRLMKKLKLRSVHFHGYTNDVKAVWAQNHLLVLPSRFEGLPLALVEAMWCGRPAVVTDIGGNAELCVDGETGYVAAAPAVSLVAETMERAWNDRDRWQNMGVAAGARVRSLLPKDPVGDFCEQLGISAAAIANGASPQRAVPASTVPIKPIA